MTTFCTEPSQNIFPSSSFYGEPFQNIPPSTTFYYEPHLTLSFHQDQWQNIQPSDFYEPQLTSFHGEPWLNPASSSFIVNQVQLDSIHYQPSDMFPSVHSQGLLTRGNDPERDPGGGGGPQQGPNVANWDPNCNRGSRDTAHTAEGEQDRLWERANPGLLRRGAHEFLTEITGGSRRGTATALATVIYMWNNSNIRKDLDWSANDINNTTQLCRHWGFAYKNATLMVMVCHMNLARLSNDPIYGRCKTKMYDALCDQERQYVAQSTFNKWVSNGDKYAWLARCVGMTGSKTIIDETPVDAIIEVGYALRDPYTDHWRSGIGNIPITLPPPKRSHHWDVLEMYGCLEDRGDDITPLPDFGAFQILTKSNNSTVEENSPLIQPFHHVQHPSFTFRSGV
ncbi:hypothetical protein BD410DRAFT_809998 [Rickenella mellea]|uniref:Uncharacterized protein n=1 Tax=Rickenella mellea TaxID=50990 RepID=A0A4Y7PI62_9AGAM|nr:hypothetical protein BD410DRAFT_809998 [Rickenella mellea]